MKTQLMLIAILSTLLLAACSAPNTLEESRYASSSGSEIIWISYTPLLLPFMVVASEFAARLSRTTANMNM